jgi:putative ABC transport system permease protein
MTTPGRKVIRDFWRERTRTVLVTLAIALGIAAFAAVLSTYAILTRELNRGHLATNPASATLKSDAIDEKLLAAVRSCPGVAEVEARRTVPGRIRAGSAGWRNLVLFVVEDYAKIRVSTLQREKGAWPPSAGEILIERDAFQVVQTRIGDTLTVRTERGTERPLRVTGSVHDVGQAQARMENIVYGYVTRETLAGLGERPELDQLKIVVSGNRFDEGHIRSVMADVARLVEGQGRPVLGLDVPKPGKHPHADIMGMLLLAMSCFGLFVLFLSGILVVNLMAALMASQVRQIGVMKTIGGTRGKVARIYLGQALLLGVAAVAIAVPAGFLGSRLLCRAMAVFLNFDIVSFDVPFWVFALVAAVGIVVPLLAASIPVWRGSGVSIREALADFGVSRNSFGTTAFDRALSGTAGVSRPVLYAIRNSFRRRTRLALTLATLSAGGLFFLSALNVRGSLITTLDRVFESRKFDLTVSLATLSPAENVDRAVRKTPGILAAEHWISTEGAFPKPGEKPMDGNASAAHSAGKPGGPHGGAALPSGRFSVVALPADSKLLKLQILEGRNLAAGDTDSIVVNSALSALEPRMKVGRTVTFQMGPMETTWRVVGLARETLSPPVAYIPRSIFDERHPGMVNSVRLVLAKTDSASIDAVKADLERNLESENVGLRAMSSKADTRLGFDQHMLMIYVFLILVSGLIAAVGGLGLMTTMSLNVLERRREMGVMRAIGASPAMLQSIVVAEGAVIGALSWAIAAIAAWPLSRGLGNLLSAVVFKSGLDFSFEPSGLLAWFVVSLALGALASFLPAAHASRCPVREALEYE